MPSDLVSIIIPCYNQAHLLPKAVQSCLDQSYTNIEIIVVDDGSPDDVQGAIIRFGSRVKLIQQKNKGLSGARNTGLFEAKGKYIKFLDSDDWLLPHCIEHQYQSICNMSKYISVIGHSLWYDGSQKVGNDIYPSFGKLAHALCYINTGPPHTYLFPMELVKKIRGFNNSFRVKGGHEDYDLLCRIVLERYDAVALHKIGCIYRKYDSTMSTNLKGMSKSRGRVWQFFANQMLLRENTPSQLVHLLGGYSLRIATGDFRYELTEILKKICGSFQEQSPYLSHDSTTLLCSYITSLRKYLPKARNHYEVEHRRLSIEILDQLTIIALENISNNTLLKRDSFNAILSLAKSHLWIERSYNFREKVAKFETLKIPFRIFNLLFSLLKIPSYFFNFRHFKKHNRKKD